MAADRKASGKHQYGHASNEAVNKTHVNSSEQRNAAAQQKRTHGQTCQQNETMKHKRYPL